MPKFKQKTYTLFKLYEPDGMLRFVEWGDNYQNVRQIISIAKKTLNKHKKPSGVYTLEVKQYVKISRLSPEKKCRFKEIVTINYIKKTK